MAKRDRAHELDTLVAAAQCSHAPDLDPLRARRMVRKAIAVADDVQLRSRRRARYLGLCAAAALLVCISSYVLTHLEAATAVSVSARGLPLRLSLKTGDTLVLAPTSKLDVLSEELALRRVRLTQGSALFDVARRTQGQRFEVETPHATVRVRGTVFSVQVRDEQSFVRVYEGSVWVVEAHGSAREQNRDRVLKTGDVWVSPGKLPASAFSTERSLESDVRAALAARGAVGHEVPAQPTESSPLTLSEPARPVSLPEPVRSLRPGVPPSLSVLENARDLLRRGQTEEVLTLARARADRDDAFLLLLADALRAAGRFGEARDQYETLAERTRGAQRAQAGFAAAQISLVPLHDAARALDDIERFALDADDSPLAERATALRAEALNALGRHDEAAQIARRYLARQPDTQASERMRVILQDTSVR